MGRARLAAWFGLVMLLGAVSAAAGQDGPPAGAPKRIVGGSTLTAAFQWPRATLDQTVEAFTVERADVPGVFEYLFNRNHLIVGLELIAPTAEAGRPLQPPQLIQGTFGPGRMRAILDEVVARDPTFTWVEDHGVATLARRANLEDPNYVFNKAVSRFDIDDLPYARALQQILLVEHQELGGPTWGFGLRHDPDSGPRVTIHLRGATVRSILNEIARQAGLGWRAMRNEGDRMMGVLITPEFSLESDGPGYTALVITPPPPRVISHLGDSPAPPASAPSSARGGGSRRGGVTPLSLPELVAKAQFIWKGEVIAATERQAVSVPDEERTMAAEVQTLTFRIDRVIKGTGPEEGAIDLYHGVGRGPLWGHLGGPFEPGWYGIVFLTEAEGRLLPTDFVYPGVEASPAPAPEAKRPEAMAAVEAELIGTLRDSDHRRVQSAADLLVTLHDQVGVAARSGPPERVVPLDREGLLAALESVAGASDPILCGTALAAMLRLGDLRRLGEAVAFIERYGPPPGESWEPSYQGTDNTRYVRGQMLHAICLLDDDAAAPLLNPLLGSSDAWVRRNAMEALRRISAISSMPYFARLIDDPDPATAMGAMWGLLMTYQRLHWSPGAWAEYKRVGSQGHTVPEWDSGMLPTWDNTFATDPDAYRAWWKDWWRKTGRPAYEAAVDMTGAVRRPVPDDGTRPTAPEAER